MGTGMRERQFGGVDYLATEINEIYINGTGTVANGANAAEIFFNRMHSARKLKGIERCFKYGDLIEELESGEL